MIRDTVLGILLGMFVDFDIRPIIRLRIGGMGLPFDICSNSGVALRCGGDDDVPFGPAVDLEGDVFEVGRTFGSVEVE